MRRNYLRFLLSAKHFLVPNLSPKNVRHIIKETTPRSYPFISPTKRSLEGGKAHGSPMPPAVSNLASVLATGQRPLASGIRHPRSPPLNSPTHQTRILGSEKTRGMGKMGGTWGDMGGGGDGEIAGIAHGMWVVEGCGGM